MLIYDGVKDPEQFEAVAAALAGAVIQNARGAKKRVFGEIARTFDLSPDAVRHVHRKAGLMKEFALTLRNKGGGSCDSGGGRQVVQGLRRGVPRSGAPLSRHTAASGAARLGVDGRPPAGGAAGAAAPGGR